MPIEKLLKEGIEKLNNSGITEPNLKSKILLAFLLSKSKEYLLIHNDEEVATKTVEDFNDAINKIANGMPLEHITKNKEFMGLSFYVDENVLIPRPDTEILVEEVIKRINSGKVLDLCTGSGAIAVSIAKYIPESIVYGSDISKKALEIANINAKNNNVNVSFIESDLFDNINENNFDAIISNPPYIETNVIRTLAEDVKHEPMLALDGGQDGLDFYRAIANEAKKYLKDRGLLALEIGYNQAESVSNLLKDNFDKLEIIKDLSGNDRVVIARLK